MADCLKINRLPIISYQEFNDNVMEVYGKDAADCKSGASPERGVTRRSVPSTTRREDCMDGG